MHILVRDKRNGVEEWFPLEQAAVLMGIAADEIDCRLEELGECECADYIALQPE
ncbi:hypothetical protein GCM10011491_19010 [Brucella endophytica]|uniref:Uncharacterized protein n=1 Tax=Brucella endophytica TaxID=1963359 RepID=A0A916SAA3_9HYPH|nr:hypothetical protein [Brucella endophytica]GGA91205.1 hypothetical protein GCM10011491_19010 [Brucella endophytica]